MKKINISLLIILFFCGVNLFAQYDTPLNEIALNDYLPTSANYPFSFVVLADTRDNSSNTLVIDPDFEVLMDQISVLNPKFVINIGDVVNGGAQEQYEAYYNYINPWMQANSIAFFTVPGNHEFNVENSYEQYYPQYIGNKDFSFDLENVRIIAINNAQHEVILDPDQAVDYTIENYQLDFVEEKLNEENSPPLKFGFTHIPILHSTNLQHEGYTAYYNLLKNHYPKANFSGHKHYYQLDNDGCGFLDIITGGGGSNIVGAEMNPPIHQSMHHFLLVTVYEDNHVDVDTYFKDEGHSTVAQAYDFTLSTTGLTGTVILDANADCLGGNNGSATASGIGGTPPYNYSWDNGEITATATNLNAGEHVCTITDSDGCEISVSVLIENGPSGITDVVHYYTDGTIDSEEYHDANIIVHENAVLTITSTVHMAFQTEVIIKKGGKIVMDGGTLTNICNEMWEGVEVQGDVDLPQNPTNQGYLKMINGSIIENAECGVRLGENLFVDCWVSNWGATGGFIKAYDSFFLNNSKDVEFLNYQNISSNDVHMNNISYFNNCEFKVNRHVYNEENYLHNRVSMWKVDGVKFVSCDFAIEDEALTEYNHFQRKDGIHASSSGFRINGECTYNFPLGSECDSDDITAHNLNTDDSGFIPSTFKNFNYGIRGNGPDDYSLITVKNCYFEANKRAIYLSALNNAKIFRNRFIIEETNNNDQEYGVYLLGCTDYEVKRNSFEGDGEINSAQRVGIWITDSGPYQNRIYLNDFSDLHAGTIVLGNNRDLDNIETGLEVLCGLYEGVKYDISVRLSKATDGSIAFIQGEAADNIVDYTAPAGNIFGNINYGNGENDYHFDQTSVPIIYQHHNTASPFNVYPIESDVPADIIPSPNLPLMTDRLQTCPKGLPTPIRELKEKVIEKQEIIVGLKTEIEGLIDGGNTIAVIDYVNNINNSTSSVRNQLINLSPYLSNEVLNAVIERGDMNQWHLCEILLANSPLRMDVWQVYEQKAPLAAYLDNLLVAYQTGDLSSKDQKLVEIKKESMQKNIALSQYIRTQLLGDTIPTDSLNEILLGETINKQIRIKSSIAIKRGDLTEATALLNQYEYNADSDIWKQLAEINFSIDNPEDATPEQILTLENIAASGKYGAYHAEALLEIINNEVIEEELNYPTPQTKSMKVKTIKRRKPTLAGVYPNPALNDFYLTYVLPTERKNAQIKIYNIQGILVNEFDITQGYGILQLNARDYKAGMYLFELILNEDVVATDKFSIIK